jgi:hypothetical protein
MPWHSSTAPLLRLILRAAVGSVSIVWLGSHIRDVIHSYLSGVM